jgi:hypothetical protein
MRRRYRNTHRGVTQHVQRSFGRLRQRHRKAIGWKKSDAVLLYVSVQHRM